MATNTLIAPTDLIIETGVRATVLVVRFADEHSTRDAARLAQHLTGHRMPGVEGVDVVDAAGDARVVMTFDPHTITRGHLELLVQDAASHV
ncbi:hypothetical protein [Nakamurella sp.]|uniref:hypothetical protein n=1 Tax=Nakamurella sp. TaxID=1869182 RepID=UPI0037835EE0